MATVTYDCRQQTQGAYNNNNNNNNNNKEYVGYMFKQPQLLINGIPAVDK